ncbi:Nickel-dependent hydrogenases b-type cytochrome subunit [Teredinibacter turnerae T7901]|uniref:Nickel-dependent hydrogenases b-type cytochrome subunit n=1 Tax=Teredinibacter turnerae (strain ATCC 39867 / T7901) TaxID=377629 RepID=C5BL04_TERTT|nr:cytochrome b [Teredinibacter turnerae]ACR12688.1 Nickel-dependent hydrogenases b-type cytochrome subunit [Teredinibacter turnerae T7901]
MTETSYNAAQRVFHWLSALTVIGLFVLGVWMTGLSYYDPLYRTAPLWHKTIGVALIVLTLVRLGWRFATGVPRALPTHKPWEIGIAHLVHWFLYAAILSMFFSGYLITTAKGQSLDLLGGISIPAMITGVDGLEDIAEEVHELTAYSIIGVAVLHALAAIKHHVIDKDRTLRRMIGR